jgi:mono/diheme cytochrome c family protein
MKRTLTIGVAAWILGLLATTSGSVLVRAQTPQTPSFYKDVLPIFQKNCQSCHRPGQIGPMPLLTYEQARPWARAIRAKVVAREMPPWFADPQYSEFVNDRRLGERDLDTIVAWVDGGAPAGNSHDAPPAVTWATEGWQIPPDLVIDSVEYEVPAKGVVEWINVRVPSGFTKDTWIGSVEVRPGDLSVVHHVCVSWEPKKAGAQYQVPTWLDRARDENGAELTKEADARAAGPRRDDTPGGRLHCYVPGIVAADFRAYDAATLVPAGADLIFSMHYNPNGKAAVDLTRVGFTIAKTPPRRQYISLSLNPSRERKYFAIPPNEPNWKAPTAEALFVADADLISLVYHMHDRGKDATTQLHFPDGRSETVLNVPRYDFNWQLTYEFKRPIRIPRGTRAQFDAHFDNTRRGGWLKPNSWVYWGDQTWEEMMGNWFGLLIDRTIDPNDVMEPLGTSSVLGGGAEG